MSGLGGFRDQLINFVVFQSLVMLHHVGGCDSWNFLSNHETRVTSMPHSIWNHLNDAKIPTLFSEMLHTSSNPNLETKTTKTPLQTFGNPVFGSNPPRKPMTASGGTRAAARFLGVICSTIAIPTNRATFPWKSSRMPDAEIELAK